MQNLKEGDIAMDYLYLEMGEDGVFDIPKENCLIKNEVVFFKIPLKVNRSDWVCAIKKRLCILTRDDENGDCLVYAVSLNTTESSYSALDKAFDEKNYREKDCNMTYGLSPRSLLVW